jgi:hypothetical protein
MAQVRYLGLFPFCVTPTDDGSLVGDGTWYPLGLTKEEVCALYWKNKSYNIACTDVGSVTYGGTETIPWDRGATGIANYNVAEGFYFTPTIETDFICADVVSTAIGWQQTPFTGNEAFFALFGYGYWNAVGNFYGVNYSLTTNCYYYNNQYYPLIYLFSQIGYNSLRRGAIDRGWTQSQIDLISVTATCTFLGKPVKLYWSGSYPTSINIAAPEDPENTLYVTGGTVSGSMVVTLDEQWPYDP